MSETWKQWEGRVVDGKFPLQTYLGGSDHSAVFLTVIQGGKGAAEKAAIKLIPRSAGAENQLTRWRAVGELMHPNLLAIYESGRCKLDGTKLLYAIEEYAEENLSQILPDRALTADETRGMLSPILAALQFAHDHGMVHGRIQPSNIFAVGDAVKLSSDSLKSDGDQPSNAKLTGDYDPPEAGSGRLSAASDVWYLGMTLIEVLTQRPPVWNRSGGNAPAIPASVPEPFHEIARQCLRTEPDQRCTVADVGLLIEGKKPQLRSTVSEGGKQAAVMSLAGVAPSGSRTISKTWSALVAVAAVAAVAFALIPRPRPSGSASAPNQPASSGENSQPAPVNSASSSSSNPSMAVPDASAVPANTANEKGVVRRVIPDLSAGGRRSIHGKIVVRVKVIVDAAGNVEKAKPESRRVSPYFKRVAVDAARDWKFAPGPSGDPSREWKLEFGFTRAKTEASAEPVQR